MKRVAPELPLALLYSSNSPFWQRRGQARRWLGRRPCTRALAGAQGLCHLARRHGYRVNVWTVNEEAEMRKLVELGVDGIITDRPALLSRILGEAR